jgi:diadenylate cyclase
VIEFLTEQIQLFWDYLGSTFTPRDVIDILVVAAAVYWVLLLIRGTRAVQMVSGLLVLMAVRLVADWANLETVSMILENFFGWAVVILVVIFQHDIRRALTRMGRPLFSPVPQGEQSEILEEVVRAAQRLSKNGVGALMVLERENGLDDVVEGGVVIDAAVNREMLAAIFQPTSPLHDGAALIQGGRLTQARCVLPLTQRAGLPEGVGTRHRAAVGLTEETDAVVVVVSEETGQIALSSRGELYPELDPPQLRDRLRDFMAAGPPPVEAVEPEEEPAKGPEEAAGEDRGTPASPRGGAADAPTTS